jgi:hypothetical protein
VPLQDMVHERFVGISAPHPTDELQRSRSGDGPASNVGTQLPFEQIIPVPHGWHATPFAPHALDEGTVTQIAPEQQPGQPTHDGATM